MFDSCIKVVGLLNDIALLTECATFHSSAVYKHHTPTECGLMIHWKESQSQPDRCL